jgi:hypothetical protein
LRTNFCAAGMPPGQRATQKIKTTMAKGEWAMTIHSKVCAKCELSLLCASGSSRAPVRSDKCSICYGRFKDMGTTVECALAAECPLRDGTLGVCTECKKIWRKPSTKLKFKVRPAHEGSEDYRVQVFGAVRPGGYQLTGELRLRGVEWHRLKYVLVHGNRDQHGKLKIEFEVDEVSGG